MVDRMRLQASTTGHEGFKAIPYLDTRKRWTFGEGRCVETNPLTAAEWKHLLDQKQIYVSITREGADWLESRQLDQVEHTLASSFVWWGNVNDARQNVFVELAFQLGVQGLMGFHDLIRCAYQNNWQGAHNALIDSDLYRDPHTQGRAKELAEQLLTGEFQ